MNRYFQQFTVPSFANALGFLLAVVILVSAPLLATTANLAIPDDTALRIRLDDTLTSVDSEVGDPFSATVVDQGEYRNARVCGHVAKIDMSGKIKGHTSMVLRFDRLVMPDGRRAPIHAEIVELYHAPSGEKVDVEGAIESGGRGRKTVEHGSDSGSLTSAKNSAQQGAGTDGCISAASAVSGRPHSADVRKSHSATVRKC